MDNVTSPPRFNERFTVYLNTEGKPVQRTLREMTAGEVMAALKWHFDESERLERETEPFAGLAKMVEDGGALPADVTHEVAMEAATALRQAGEAHVKAGRLMRMVHISLPQWDAHKGIGLGEAIRRFWPRCAP